MSDLWESARTPAQPLPSVVRSRLARRRAARRMRTGGIAAGVFAVGLVAWTLAPSGTEPPAEPAVLVEGPGVQPGSMPAGRVLVPGAGGSGMLALPAEGVGGLSGFDSVLGGSGGLASAGDGAVRQPAKNVWESLAAELRAQAVEAGDN